MLLCQLCDNNCKVLLDKKELKVCKDHEVVLKEYQNLKDGLWDVLIASTIASNNYVMPPIHLSLCASNNNSSKSFPTLKK